MRMEVPACTRCCFCLPLRHGLIFWGYLKLVILSLIALVMGLHFASLIRLLLGHPDLAHESGFVLSLTVLLVILIVSVTQMAFTIVFIIGGHKKTPKLLRIYYINSIVVLVLLTLIIAVFLVLELTSLARLAPDSFTFFLHLSWYFLISVSLGLCYVVLEAYHLLLLRSEITKLRNNCEFRFSNNTADAQCFLYVENQPLNKDIVKTCMNQ